MFAQTKILLWRLLAILAMGLAVIGVVLPVMPTVPFLLLATWAASKGWPALHTYLLSHPVYGPPIREWEMHRAVSRRVKWLACTMMSGSAVMLWFMPVPDLLRWAIYAAFLSIGWWLCLRPEPPPAVLPVRAS